MINKKLCCCGLNLVLIKMQGELLPILSDFKLSLSFNH
uniref:Uncharacterized protein n=1 Tax=Rhizophora mucronata TaxID=61149 RepID=A0A2P2QF62_RHIMU